MIHRLDLRKEIGTVAVVGCGGTGTAIAGGMPFLRQARLNSSNSRLRKDLDVVFVDGDRVSDVNCVRQPFSRSEIGLHKATVIANRLNTFWGLNWKSSPQYFSDKTDGKVDLLITCVDTRAARLAITRSPAFKTVSYWLDIGNNADNGQFVLGQPRNPRNRYTHHRLPTVAELYPEIVMPLLDSRDNLPSCSSIEALDKQEPFVNPILANHALFLLARLFRHGEIDHQGLFINLKTGRTGVIPVQHREPVKRKRKAKYGSADQDLQ